MKKSKAMKGLEQDAKHAEINAREFDERVRGDDMDDFDHRTKPDAGRAKDKMDNAGRNVATHAGQGGGKSKNHFDNRKK